MRFSLRSLLVLVFLAALMAAVFRAEQDRVRQDEALDTIGSIGSSQSGLFHRHTGRYSGTQISLFGLHPDYLRSALRRLQQCPDVRSLSLHNMQLDDGHWRLIARLRGLYRLEFDGPPPSDVVIHQMPPLRSLAIREPQTFTPDGITAFAKQLDADPTFVEGWLHGYANMIVRCAPKELSLEGDMFLQFDFAWLHRHTSLQALRLALVRHTGSYTPLKYRLRPAQMSEICSLTWLQELELKCDVDPHALEQIGRLHRLRNLILDESIVPSQELTHLADLPRLRRLELTRATLELGWLEQVGLCTSLTELDLSFTPLISERLEYLAGLVRLRQLNLQQRFVWDGDSGDPFHIELQGLPELPALETLVLSHTHVSPQHWPALARLPKLHRLAVGMVRLGRRFTETVANHRALRVLEVDQDALGRKDLQSLRGLTLEGDANCLPLPVFPDHW